MSRSRLGTVVVCGLFLALAAPAGASEDNVEQERTLSEILQDKRLQEAKERGDFSRRDTTPEEEAARTEREEQQQLEGGGKKGRFAILPEIGFGPEKGANGGIKLTDRDLFGLTLDVSASGAQRGQAKGKVQLIAPDLLDGWLILAGFGLFQMDPSKRFFGLGNSDADDGDELSRHRYQHQTLRLLAGLRLTNRFTVAVSGGYNLVDIGHGSKPRGTHVDVPPTSHVFPDMAGVRGGKTNPLAVSLVFDDRDEVTRPTRGWNVIVKYERVDEALENDFEYNRYIFEASYLYPLLTRRQVIGLRAGGEYIDSKRRQVPFYELSSLGGGDDMRGYFPDRFLGRAKVIFGGEYRLKLFDFDFFNIWNVKIDGVAFGDGGRVFMKETDVLAEAGDTTTVAPEDATPLPRTKDEMRWSYGGGVRFALGEATIARVDVGFSEEEQGLVYLVFGHTF